jgi:hypothetical protein
MTKRLIILLSITLFASLAFADKEQEADYSNHPGIDVASDFEATETPVLIQPEDRGFGKESQEAVDPSDVEDMNSGQQDDARTGLEYRILNPAEEVRASEELERAEAALVSNTTNTVGKNPQVLGNSRRDLESLRTSFINYLESNNCEALYVTGKTIANSLRGLDGQEVTEFINELRSLDLTTTCDIVSETTNIMRWLSGQVGSRLAVSRPVLNFNGQVFFDSQASEAQLQSGDEIQVLFHHNSLKQVDFSYNFTTNLNLGIDYQLQQLFHGNASHLVIAYITITQEMVDAGYLEIILNVSDASDESRILDMQVVHIRL